MNTGTRDGLECRAGERRIVVPLGDVQRIVELDIDAPPPLASTWISGLGLLDRRVAVVVDVAAAPRRAEPRRVVGLELCDTGAGPSIVLEISRVVGPVRGAPAETPDRAHPWLVGDWVDVAALRADLGA